MDFVMDLILFSVLICTLVALYFAAPERLLWRQESDAASSIPKCPYCLAESMPGAVKCSQCKEWIDPELQLTASGSVLFLLCCISILGLLDLQFHVVPVFKGFFKQIGGVLPKWTTIGMSLQYTGTSIAIILTLSIISIKVPTRLSIKNKMLGCTFVLGIIVNAIQMYTLYLPIFTLANRIR